MKTSSILLVLIIAASTRADISEYFLRDPYDQLDLFRQSSLDKTTTTTTPSPVAEGDQDNQDELFEEYFDYLYEVGALEKKKTTSTVKPRQKKPQPQRKTNRLRPRKGHLEVNADVLERVKQPKPDKKRFMYRNRHHKDNIAAESISRRVSQPSRTASASPKEDQANTLPGLENVERLIPSSLKTVIQDSGKRIVKAVMQPVVNNVPRHTQIRESSFTSQMESWISPYRSYFGYMAPTFAPDHITSYLVAQWVSTVAITVAWVTVGYMYQTMTGRSSEGRSNPEPWESLVPNSDTVASVLYDLSVTAQRWHDEL